ncbi:MAG: helix-hairpin-helix domain-containing protein [Deltaproteobacteria bacterium]|nr:helix-hairpin-helix domain-containing protein [Deltaproteobacteria bacterium]
MRRLVAILALIVIAGLPGAASAYWSTFKVAGKAKPIAGGARVKLRYDNRWGSAQLDEQNKQVRLWLDVGDAPPRYSSVGASSNGMFRAPGSKQFGVVDMLGRGQIEIDIDYRRFGYKGGDTVWISGCWLKSGHVFGDFWGRPVGSLVLPGRWEKTVWQVNSATLAELCELPGIGKARAQKIIAQRQLAPIRNFKMLEALLGAKAAQPLKGKLRYAVPKGQ